MNIRDIISSAAPFLGTLIGGPAGGMAMKALSQILLGKSDASDSEIQHALLSASPDQLAAIKKIDADFKVRMAQVAVDEKKLFFDDKANARGREIAVKDNLPAILAILITLIFFALIIIVILLPIQTGSKDLMEIMIGAVETAWILAVSYYFGSSNKHL